ncbi:hypothetical protein [Absidia glauca]|uniref:Reverse transcriptase n=1 Tax=Absidia glauca TaxID=4829 RepID=A0A163IR17_ABSGL|nr:hypothetical protein [Absidia glauca]
MSLSAEQVHLLDDLVRRFNELHDSLPPEINGLWSVIDELENRISRHSAAMDLMEERLRHQAATMVSNLETFMSTQFVRRDDATPARPAIKVKEPTTFSGRSSSCAPFFSQLALCFAANPSRFLDDHTKILFAISHLSGNAFAYMEPYLSKLEPADSRPTILTDFSTFRRQIVGAFGDSNPVVNAEAAIRDLKQLGPASVYATEFRRLAMLLSWNEAALISQYRLHLKDPIQDELTRRDSIDSLDDLIATSIDIDNRLFTRQRQKQNTPRSEPQLMDLSIVTTHQPLTAAQKQYRRDHNLCMYCGAPGHFTNTCPKKRSQASLSTILMAPDDEPQVAPPASLMSMLSHSSRRDRLVLPVSISIDNINFIDTLALIDSGASGSFVDSTFARANNLHSFLSPVDVSLANGTVISSTHAIRSFMRITSTNHQEVIEMQRLTLGSYPIILGLSWLKAHDPVITWSTGVVNLPCTKPACLHDKTMTSHSRPPISFIGAAPMEIYALDNVPTNPLPAKYSEFAPVFSKAEADRLPDHRPYDHSIALKPDSQVPFGPLYNLSKVELETLYEYIQENLAKGFIRRSESPAGAPVTIPNRYPLPLISETLDRLNGATIFTKLDMRGAYNLVRVANGDEWKTAFRTRYGHFEYLVMPFGLTNAPATFQAFVNDVLREYLDNYVVVYLDDILIFSRDATAHADHVRLVLAKLAKAKLSLKLEKCEFDVSSVQFLGFVISPLGVTMDPSKVEAIKNWPTPSSAHDIQVFLGLANFYRRFVKDYSKICVPLTALLKKNCSFVWSNSAKMAFNLLKSLMSSDPVLRHYNPDLPCVIETDASDFALGAVCSQADDQGQLHPLAFYSRKLIPAETNYQVYDKELLAIVSASPTLVLTDHRNLEYFATTRNLSRRQVRWAEILGDYNFTIKFRPGKSNGAADALSRRDNPERGDTSTKHTSMQLLDSKVFLATLTSSSIEPTNNDMMDTIKAILPDDPHFGLICIPDSPEIKRTILAQCHDTPSAGHFGEAKTFELVNRNFHWPGLRKYIKTYISGCDSCCRNKNQHHRPYGLLQPLPIPETPWTSVSVDFITQLPKSCDYTAICVFVCRLSKMALFIPTYNEIDAVGTSNLFIKHVFSHFGLPQDIVSDRGATFTSKFTQSLLQGLKVKQSLSTAFHPQTDGQTERVNSVLEQYLRCFINYQQSDWSDLLPLAHIRISSFRDPTSTKHLPINASSKSTKHIRTQRQTGKLDHRRLGPFRILQSIGSRSFKLALSPTMKLHPVFHVNLLEPYHQDEIPGRPTEPLPPVTVNAHQEYEVDYIVGSRIHRNKLQYLVHWKGYDIMDRTWKPLANLDNSTILLDEYHQAHPDQPGGLAGARPREGASVINPSRSG